MLSLRKFSSLERNYKDIPISLKQDSQSIEVVNQLKNPANSKNAYEKLFSLSLLFLSCASSLRSHKLEEEKIALNEITAVAPKFCNRRTIRFSFLNREREQTISNLLSSKCTIGVR